MAMNFTDLNFGYPTFWSNISGRAVEFTPRIDSVFGKVVSVLPSSMAEKGLTGVLYILLALASCFLMLQYLLGVEHDPREPTMIMPRLPILGHAISLVTKNNHYYTALSKRRGLPIYSISVLGSKVYVVNTPELALAVQRNAKALSFQAAVTRNTIRMFPKDSKVKDMVAEILNPESTFSVELHKGVRATMAQGPNLDTLGRITLDLLNQSIGDLCSTGSATKINLFEWVQHAIMIATSEAAYGPTNPFRNKKVEDGLWAIDADGVMLMTGIFPQLLARRAYIGKEHFVNGFKKYFSNGEEIQASASEMLKLRYNACVKFGITPEDMALFELGSALSLAGNTTPAIFWIIYYAFSNPELLADLRTEAERLMTTEYDINGLPARRLDVTTIKDQCPLLTSTFQEVLRIRTTGASARMAIEDTMLAGRYLLKKGGLVQIPSHVIHSDAAIWGPDVNQFNPRRFMQKQKNGAFRSFGFGDALCPGRHLASTQSLSVLAMFALRYDLTSANGSWTVVNQDKSKLLPFVAVPKEKFAVEITPRKGYDKGSWSFHIQGTERSKADVTNAMNW